MFLLFRVVTYHEQLPAGTTKALRLHDPARGRYVYITLAYSEILTLCEVEVYVTTCKLEIPGLKDPPTLLKP